MALTLNKTGITNNSTIQAWHVSQSIDALTGAVAYNITISGSLKLTGSVTSQNGYTGSLYGTSSWAESSSYSIESISSSYSTTSEKVVGAFSSNGQPSIAGNLKFVGGAAQIPSGNKDVPITISELNGKTLGTDCFVSIAYSSSVTASNMQVGVDSLAGSTLTFKWDALGGGGSTPLANVDFFYTIIYTV